MNTVICINGQFLPASRAQIPALDQGFLYGYGLFETILVRGGQPVLLEAHLKRLEKGCTALGMALPLLLNELGSLVHQTIKLNNTVDGALRLTLSAGMAPGEAAGNLVVSTRPLPYSTLDYQKGLRAGWSSFRRNEQSPLVKFKTLNYLENVLAKKEARESGWDEALFLNTAGYVAEGAVSNIFLVKNGQVITPSLDQGLLPGIMRQVVLETCRRLGIAAQERPVSPHELLDADECFLTNSLMMVMPLVKIYDSPIGSGQPGVVTEEIKMAVSGHIS
ncbi:aminodeoxychorismate lyase [Desulfofundulus luciae]|uniref:Aminodeoxychorismate lyase n=1 Tax=Desulfofundulus luciae TaxID=74702 RepID=A0ABU0B2C3_9FIRM|nr:aminodeoxychorismate lyase [Desulfofundulus luciae]